MLVIVILFVPGNFRAALITAMVIRCPCCSPSPAWSARRSAPTLMSLGALDFGIIIDGAVVIVENCVASGPCPGASWPPVDPKRALS